MVTMVMTCRMLGILGILWGANLEASQLRGFAIQARVSLAPGAPWDVLDTFGVSGCWMLLEYLGVAVLDNFGVVARWQRGLQVWRTKWRGCACGCSPVCWWKAEHALRSLRHVFKTATAMAVRGAMLRARTHWLGSWFAMHLGKASCACSDPQVTMVILVPDIATFMPNGANYVDESWWICILYYISVLICHTVWTYDSYVIPMRFLSIHLNTSKKFCDPRRGWCLPSQSWADHRSSGLLRHRWCRGPGDGEVGEGWWLRLLILMKQMAISLKTVALLDSEPSTIWVWILNSQLFDLAKDILQWRSCGVHLPHVGQLS